MTKVYFKKIGIYQDNFVFFMFKLLKNDILTFFQRGGVGFWPGFNRNYSNTSITTTFCLFLNSSGIS